MLRPKYKNEIFALLNNTQPGVDSFEYEDAVERGEDAFIITFKQTPLKFLIINAPNSYEAFKYMYTFYAPGFPISHNLPGTGFCNFNTLIGYLADWLGNQLNPYIEDLVETDLWATYINSPKSLNLSVINFNEQTAFSTQERVKFAILELKLLIQQQFQTSAAQQQLVNERLDYLADGVDRLNKFDWMGILFNIIIAITIALTLDTEKGRSLYELFKKVLSGIPQLGR